MAGALFILPARKLFDGRYRHQYTLNGLILHPYRIHPCVKLQPKRQMIPSAATLYRVLRIIDLDELERLTESLHHGHR